MSLNNIDLNPDARFKKPPNEVLSFLADAEVRSEQFFARRTADQARIPTYVSSNYYVAYNALQHIRINHPDNIIRFCEWGSGFGIVACLAALLGFKAHGIEIEVELLAEATQLAADYDLDVAFFHGSYKPFIHAEPLPELDFAATDFDLIYAYPWPAEEKTLLALFAQSAALDSVFLTYHGGGKISGWQREQTG